MKKNYTTISVPDYGYANGEHTDTKYRIERKDMSTYLSRCDLTLRRVAYISSSCEETVYPSTSYQDFIQPITYLLNKEYQKEYGKIPYKNGYITIELDQNTNILGHFLYHSIDSKGIYKFYLSDIVVWQDTYNWNSIDG
jgi:hypothetical protein